MTPFTGSKQSPTKTSEHDAPFFGVRGRRHRFAPRKQTRQSKQPPNENNSVGNGFDVLKRRRKNGALGFVRRLNSEETMVRVSTTCTVVSLGQNPGRKLPPFLAA